MDLTSLDWTWWMLEWNGNRAAFLAGAEPAPLELELRTPGWGYTRSLATRATLPSEHRSEIDKVVFRDHVRGVRNLRLDGAAVTTGEELWRLGAEENRIEAALFLETFKA